jgi:hypothetical protein
MSQFHFFKVSIVGLAMLFATLSNAAANSTEPKAGEMTAHEDQVWVQPPDGYYLVNEEEMEGLYEQPLNLLSDARQKFKEGNVADAAQDINAASLLMKVQAMAEPKGSHIRETANNLHELSKRVAKNEIKTISTLNYELTRAARDEAEYHRVHAAEASVHHLYKNVSTDLKEAVAAVEKSIEWSGQKISDDGEKVMTSTKEISRKIKAGEKQTAEEIRHSIASLETEIGRLENDAKSEQKKR